MNEQKETAYNLFRCRVHGVRGLRFCVECYNKMLADKPKWFIERGIKTRAQCRSQMEITTNG